MVSIRLDRQLVAQLRKQALTERVNFSDYIRDLVFEALAGHDIRADLAEVQVAIEEIAGNVGELKADVQTIKDYLTDE